MDTAGAGHCRKYRRAKSGLPEIIADESIITSDGKRTVKVPIRSLEEYRFRFDPYQGEKTGQGDGDSKVGDILGRVPGRRDGQGKQAGDGPGSDYFEAEVTVDDLAELIFADLGLPDLRPKATQEIPSESVKFTEVRKHGPMSNLDKRRTIMENMKRNAQAGHPTFGDLTNEDLRFKVWEQELKPTSSAVVIAMRDASGSMGEFKKYITRSLFFWMMSFALHVLPEPCPHTSAMRGDCHVNGERPIDSAKVAAYIRWSTDDQGLGTTLAVQQEACLHFILSQGWTFRPELLFVDDGYSGGTLDRPGLTRLRAHVADGDVEAVVVFKIDRLSRSVIDTVNLVLKEWEGRCFVKSTREPIDTTTPAGKLFFYMLVSYAEWERSVIRERTLAGKRKRAEQGRNAGQKYPYGYRRADGGGWALDGRDPASGQLIGPAAVVGRIFRRYLDGAGLGAIAAELNRDGVATPEGRAWRAAYVGRILANPNYAGTYRYGLRQGGRKVEGAMAPILSAADWETAQQLRQGRASRRSKAQAGRYLLSGLAVCGRCGTFLAGSRGATRRYYVCSSRAQPGRAQPGRTQPSGCDCGCLDADALEQAVLAEVRAFVDAQIPGPLLDVWAELERRRAEQEGTAARAAADVAQVGARRRRLEEQFLDGTLDAATFRSLRERLEVRTRAAADRLALAQAALGEARSALDQAQTPGPDPGTDLGPDPWLHLQFDELRQLLRELIAELRVYQPKHRPGGTRTNGCPIRLDWTPRCAESK